MKSIEHGQQQTHLFRLASTLALVGLYIGQPAFSYDSASDDLDLKFSGDYAWDASAGELTFRTSGEMPDSVEGFFWNVPSSVKKIVIDRDVRVTGGFRIFFRPDDNPLWIEGRDRSTSILYGTNEQAWTDRHDINENDKWKYSGISVIEDAVVHVADLTVENPRGYLVSGYANKAVLHLESCTLRDTRVGDNNNSDGFAGAAGSSLKDCLISTADDGIKIYHDLTIEDVTIEQHRNGAPIQLGWGGGAAVVHAKIKNLVIRGVDAEHRYNMAPITWEAARGGKRNIEIEGLRVESRGEVYNEERQAWEPLGLFELKPMQSEFNLNATQVTLNGLPLGKVLTRGQILLDGVVMTGNN